VRWACLGHSGLPEWAQTSVIFRLTAVGPAATRLGFTHTGLRPGLDCYRLCSAGLFFLAIMPQFIPHHAPVTGYTLAFTATDMVIIGAWLAIVAWISDKAGTLSRHPRVRTALDRTTGTALVALGLRVAAEQLA